MLPTAPVEAHPLPAPPAGAPECIDTTGAGNPSLVAASLPAAGDASNVTTANIVTDSAAQPASTSTPPAPSSAPLIPLTHDHHSLLPAVPDSHATFAAASLIPLIHDHHSLQPAVPESHANSIATFAAPPTVPAVSTIPAAPATAAFLTDDAATPAAYAATPAAFVATPMLPLPPVLAACPPDGTVASAAALVPNVMMPTPMQAPLALPPADSIISDTLEPVGSATAAVSAHMNIADMAAALEGQPPGAATSDAAVRASGSLSIAEMAAALDGQGPPYAAGARMSGSTSARMSLAEMAAALQGEGPPQTMRAGAGAAGATHGATSGATSGAGATAAGLTAAHGSSVAGASSGAGAARKSKPSKKPRLRAPKGQGPVVKKTAKAVDENGDRECGVCLQLLASSHYSSVSVKQCKYGLSPRRALLVAHCLPDLST